MLKDTHIIQEVQRETRSVVHSCCHRVWFAAGNMKNDVKQNKLNITTTRKKFDKDFVQQNHLFRTDYTFFTLNHSCFFIYHLSSWLGDWGLRKVWHSLTLLLLEVCKVLRDQAARQWSAPLTARTSPGQVPAVRTAPTTPAPPLAPPPANRPQVSHKCMIRQ